MTFRYLVISILLELPNVVALELSVWANESGLFDCRRCFVWDLVRWGALFGCDGRMVWPTLVEFTLQLTASYDAPCFCSSDFMQTRW